MANDDIRFVRDVLLALRNEKHDKTYRVYIERLVSSDDYRCLVEYGRRTAPHKINQAKTGWCKSWEADRMMHRLVRDKCNKGYMIYSQMTAGAEVNIAVAEKRTTVPNRPDRVEMQVTVTTPAPQPMRRLVFDE